MTALHVLLATLVAVIWGAAFVASKVALEHFSPPQLVTLRFLIAALPALVLRRPPVPWSALLPIGLTWFTGQFLLQFFGIALGMPPGLAAVAVQTQALFTVLLAAWALREPVSRRQGAGMALAVGGLAMIGLTAGRDLTLVGLGLTVLAAVSWGIGNVLVKRIGPVDVLALAAWLSLVPPLPSIGLSWIMDGPGGLGRAVASAPGLALGAAVYLGGVATVVAYALWGMLLRRYPAATVAPFALLVPCVGAVASHLALGERFGGTRLAGMALVLLGLAVLVWPRARAAVAAAPPG